MSFFEFDKTHDALEKEKEKLRQGGCSAQEDVAVYTWGESDYDGLGDALQEGGDELNDETFGGSDPVGANIIPLHFLTTHQHYFIEGKDFDFSKQGPSDVKQDIEQPESHRGYQDSLLHGKPQQPCAYKYSVPLLCVLLAHSCPQHEPPVSLWNRYGMTSRLSRSSLGREAEAASQTLTGLHLYLPSQTLKHPRQHRTRCHAPVMYLDSPSRVYARSKRSKQRCTPNKASRTMCLL